MFLYFNLFFVIVVLKTVGAKNPLATLDIDNYDKKHFKIKSVEFDNVYYEHFAPTKKFFVKNVTQSGNKIWESDGIGTCVYCIMAKSHGNPYILYLKIDHGYIDDHYYYIKKDDIWKTMDIYEYSNSITQLKKDVGIEKLFVLNVSSSFSYDLFSVEYASADKPYTFFSPNVGFLVTEVRYNSTKLWSAYNKGDRCVAAWAYMHTGSYYMIRLLITMANEESELRTFFVINGRWQLVHTLQHNYDSKEHVKGPENFLYPNYTFNLKPVDNIKDIPDDILYEAFSEGKKLPTVSENTVYLEYMEGKYYQTKQTDNTNTEDMDKIATKDNKEVEEQNNDSNKLDSKEDTDQVEDNKEKTNENEEDKEDKPLPTENKEDSDNNDATKKPLDPNDYQPIVKVIRKKSCLKLDISNRIDNYKYENLAVFDNNLHLVSYNPPPGKYFDLVTDGNKPLFVGNYLNSVCQSVNFYLKDTDFYLVEVVVRVENKDSIRHFKKENSIWVYLDKKQFTESLKELKDLVN